jgi:hypothetical protein
MTPTPRWPERDGEYADTLNGMPKYVVSSTIEDPSWENSTVLRGEVPAEVASLKQRGKKLRRLIHRTAGG